MRQKVQQSKAQDHKTAMKANEAKYKLLEEKL